MMAEKSKIDDWFINMPILDELQSHGLLRLLHNKKYRFSDRIDKRVRINKNRQRGRVSTFNSGEVGVSL